ncbi:MAG: Tex-like N-terminal domain-containing protein, partial [Acidobacteriota bacterium]
LTEDKVGFVQERMDYYREVRDKQSSLFKSLSEQGKLTEEIRDRIKSCITKVELDDLHHRFRSRKKTRLREATEKGLQPLAEYFRNQEADAWSMEEHVQVFVDASRDLSSPEEALRGCVDIIAEWIGEKYEYRQALREMLEKDGFVISNVVPAKVNQKTKYTMYYERRESVTTIPSHRILAIRRGCKEGILISSIEGDHSKALEYLMASVIKRKDFRTGPVHPGQRGNRLVCF